MAIGVRESMHLINDVGPIFNCGESIREYIHGMTTHFSFLESQDIGLWYYHCLFLLNTLHRVLTGSP